MRSIIILVFLSILGRYPTTGLQCYTCAVSVDDPDQTCVTNPAEVIGANAVTNCDKKYCTSVRVEYMDPKNKVQSMHRSCEDKPLYINQIFEDFTFRTFYRACTTDLCNGGSGKDVSADIFAGDDGDPIVLIVRGIGGGTRITTSILVIIALEIIYYIMAY